MKLLSFLPLVLAVQATAWLSKAAYNNWHKTELEQWLSDNNVPYPTAADRKDLQDLVAKNWKDYVVTPYNSWDADQLAKYLEAKGIQAKEAADQDRNALVAHVQRAWTETEDRAEHAYNNIKDWILDTWSDSQLKAFCDYHDIPVPQPRERDVLLQHARHNYEIAAKKMHQTVGYPGNWLYDTWTESELKQWLDTYGFPSPQPSTRDKLISTVRRNSHLAYLKLQDDYKAAKNGAFGKLNDKVLNGWSDSELKNFCDKNGIKVPQGSKTEEIRALIRHRRAQILGDNAGAKVSSAFGAATSKAGNDYARSTQAVSEAAAAAFRKAADLWSASRLKGFLDARGVAVPQTSSLDELRALVRKNAHLVPTVSTAWALDDLSYEKLRDYLIASGNEAGKKIAETKDASRDELVSAAHAAYTSASKAGGDQFASATSYLSAATEAAKDNLFDTWSESEIKAYLDTYGIPIPQGSTTNELRAYARQQATYFKYGTMSPSSTLFAKASEGLWGTIDWIKSQVQLGADAAQKQAESIRKKINNDEL